MENRNMSMHGAHRKLAQQDKLLGVFDDTGDMVAAFKSLVSEMEIAMAAYMARSGNYSVAENILADISSGTIKDHPERLDLLARMSAQQGRLAEAEGYWERARRGTGNDSAYEQPLRRLAVIQQRKVRTLLFNPVPLTMLAILIFTVMFYWFANQTNHIERMINDQASAMHANMQLLEQSLQSSDKPLTLTLDIPGVTVTPMNGDATLRFDEGLFIRGVTLDDGATEQIKAVGRALEPYASGISVSVTGHSDDLAMTTGNKYGDNISLGMARAMTVVDILRKEGGLPSAILSARSDGQYKTPFPNDTPENRMKNRTVVISVSRSDNR